MELKITTKMSDGYLWYFADENGYELAATIRGEIKLEQVRTDTRADTLLESPLHFCGE